MSIYRIKIFSNFCDSSGAKSTFERLCDTASLSNYGPDKEIYITNDDDYTHAIIMNTAMPILKNIPKQNVVGLAFEPPVFLGLSLDFVEYAEKYLKAYFIGDKYDLTKERIRQIKEKAIRKLRHNTKKLQTLINL